MAASTGKSVYEGKISNKGAQVVQAPFAQSKGPANKVIKGKNCRTGKGGK